MEDWRLTNQEKYMLCICLKKIIPSESLLFKNNIYRHEHCEFCMDKISIDTKDECYCTIDNYRFICKTCFNDFKSRFKWKVED